MKKILFCSTNGHSEKVDFKGALLKGQAPDKGLYMPESIPSIPLERVNLFSKMSYPEIAYEVILPFIDDLVPGVELQTMLSDAYNFEVPVEKVYDGKYVVRLDRGP